MLNAGTELRVSTTRFAVREMYTTGKSVRAVIRRAVLAKEYCKNSAFYCCFVCLLVQITRAPKTAAGW
jgi:hypothetical protein